MEVAAQDEADTKTRSDRQEHEVVDAAGDALPLLAERRQVDVVLERDGEAEPALEVGSELTALEIREVRQMDPTALGVDDARHSDHRAVDEVGVEPGRGLQRGVQGGDRVDRGLRSVCREFDVLPRSHRAGEIAHGATDEPRAEVEPEHEGCLRDRLEEDRPVARTTRIVARLAHETGLEQRLQRERHGRLRDTRPPRDLRA